MGILEAISVLEMMGLFNYLYPFLLVLYVSFPILFFLINKIKFLEEKKAIKSLINLFISRFLANIIALFSLQLNFFVNLFVRLYAYFIPISIFHILFIVIFVLSTIIWIVMLVDAIRREFLSSSEKTVWIILIILGGLFGGWIYYFMVKFNKKQESS